MRPPSPVQSVAAKKLISIHLTPASHSTPPHLPRLVNIPTQRGKRSLLWGGGVKRHEQPDEILEGEPLHWDT